MDIKYTVVSSEINELIDLQAESEAYQVQQEGKLISVPFCQVATSLYSITPEKCLCVTSEQNFCL